MWAFQTQNLVKNYKGKLALDNLNMNVPTGSIYGFLGVNGAGKTTTFGIAGTYTYATSGSFKVKGKLAVIPQDARFYYGRSVESQLRFLAELSGVKKEQIDNEVMRVLLQVGLTEKAKTNAEKLSHGMYKRLGIAQALLGSPDLLLLDEPTAGLDPENAFEIRNLIKELGKKKTLVISSHNLNEIADICTHVGIIHKGRMIYEGKMSEIANSSAKVKYVLSHIDEQILGKLLKEFEWIEKFSMEANNSLHVLFSEQKIKLEEVNQQIIKALFNTEMGVQEIHSGRSLEETFLEIINKHSRNN
jgi:ABC-2 type transport system ATP-binding protein